MMFLFVFYLYFFSALFMIPFVDAQTVACAIVATLGTRDFVWVVKRLLS